MARGFWGGFGQGGADPGLDGGLGVDQPLEVLAGQPEELADGGGRGHKPILSRPSPLPQGAASRSRGVASTTSAGVFTGAPGAGSGPGRPGRSPRCGAAGGSGPRRPGPG